MVDSLQLHMRSPGGVIFVRTSSTLGFFIIFLPNVLQLFDHKFSQPLRAPTWGVTKFRGGHFCPHPWMPAQGGGIFDYTI